jgi:hypothetical protein
MNIIKPEHNLMLILLSNLSGNENSEEIYDRTRFAWKTKLERAQNVDFVIAHNSKEEIIGIYEPLEWLRADDEEFHSLNRGVLPDRVGFIGGPAPSHIQNLYSGYLTPPRKKGAANPIRYLEIDDDDDDDGDEDLDALLDDLELELSDEDDSEGDDNSVKKHTYLVGVSTDDESPESVLDTAFEFVETAYYKFSQKLPVYIVLNSQNEEGIDFLNDINILSIVKLYEGCWRDDDPEPNKDDIKNALENISNGRIFDEGYMKLWFIFEFPEEDEDEWEEPGSHWEDAFFQLVKDFDAVAMIGYHSEIEDNIWQQWGGGEYDEGAISNSDVIDHYKGENLSSIHKVDLKCLDINNFPK